MGKVLTALKSKYATPQAAMAALGVDFKDLKADILAGDSALKIRRILGKDTDFTEKKSRPAFETQEHNNVADEGEESDRVAKVRELLLRAGIKREDVEDCLG